MFVLVLAIFGSLAMPAAAVNFDDLPEINVGDCLSLMLEPEQTVFYKFVAPETTTYVLWAESYPKDQGSFSVMDASYMQVGQFGTGRTQFDAVAGQTYYLSMAAQHRFQYVGEPLVVHLDKGVPVERIETEKSSYYCYMNSSIAIPYTVYPVNGIVKGQIQFADEDMARVYFYQSSTFTYIYIGLAAGQTTVTYTNENGVKATCTLEFRDFEPIELNSAQNVTIAPGEAVGFKYIPSEAGYYYFVRSGAYDETGSLNFEMGSYKKNDPSYYSGGTWSGAGATSMFKELSTEQCGVMVLTNNSDQTFTGTIRVLKGVPPTSLSIVPFVTEIDDSLCVDVSCDPEYVAYENLTWTSSNPDVLDISWSSADYCYVSLKKEGTAVLTVTAESGLSASYTVTVGATQTGWIKSGNKWYYMKEDGVVTGLQEIGGKYYYFDAKGAMQTGWHTASGVRRYFGTGGAAVTGWHGENGKWYYLRDGVAQKGWLKTGGSWYFLDKSTGVMQTGWVKDGNYWYYMNKSGVMLTGTQTIDGKTYTFNASGVWIPPQATTAQNGWQQNNGKWYYYKNGAVQTGWQKVGNYWYYMDGNGVMQTGLKQIGGKYYYLSGSGVMMTGWQTVNGVRHLFASNGAAVTGWHQESGKWYFLKNTGAVTTGWMQDGGSWYFMDKSTGAMKTGWVQDGNYWYYMNKSGVMQTGWVKDGNYWYYMNKSGVMLTGTQVIDGKTYKFNSSGVWIG